MGKCYYTEDVEEIMDEHIKAATMHLLDDERKDGELQQALKNIRVCRYFSRIVIKTMKEIDEKHDNDMAKWRRSQEEKNDG